MLSVPTITSTSPSSPACGDRAAAARAQRARGVCLVDDDQRPMAARERNDLRQRRDVAVHREHRVGDDHIALAALLAQRPLEVADVAVAVDEDVRRGRDGSRR